MTMRFFLTGDAYQTLEARALRTADIVRRVESLPGVRAAFASNLIPLGGGGGGGRATVEGRIYEKGEEPNIGFTAVTPHLHRTLTSAFCAAAISPMPKQTRSVPRHRQRDDGETALAESGCARPPFKVAGTDTGDEWFTVIGVAADFFHSEMDDQDPLFPCAYVPHGWMATPNTGLTIRVDGDPAKITAAVRAAIREADPNIPPTQIRTMEELRAPATGSTACSASCSRCSGRGAVPRVDRRIRRAVVRGVAADAGDWRPRRARRGSRRRAAAGRRAGPQAGRHRHLAGLVFPCRRTSSSSRFCS